MYIKCHGDRAHPPKPLQSPARARNVREEYLLSSACTARSKRPLYLHRNRGVIWQRGLFSVLQPVSFFYQIRPITRFSLWRDGTGCCSAKPVVTGYWLLSSAQKREPRRNITPIPPRSTYVRGGVRLHEPAFSTGTLFVDVWGTSYLTVCSVLPPDRHNLRGQIYSGPVPLLAPLSRL